MICRGQDGINSGENKNARGASKIMNIILASGSPRRRELLAQAGFEFKVEVSNADENVVEESPEQMVEELAARKAEAVVRLHNKAEDNCLVIGADTIVVLEGKVLGNLWMKKMQRQCWLPFLTEHIRYTQELHYFT